MFCWRSISKRDEIMSVPTTSLSPYTSVAIQTAWNQVKTNGYITPSFLFLKENVCSGYSLEAALSNVNDSFTLSRFMKRPKHFVIRQGMSTHNLHLFLKYTESVSTIFKPIRHRTPTLFKCCSLIFDRITC